MDIAKSGLCYKQIIIEGIVQGVGFRPFVFKLAKRHKIRGNVKNAGGAVNIAAVGQDEDMAQFINAIQTEAHAPMCIEHICQKDTEPFDASDFKITESRTDNENEMENRFISPDIALCDNCLSEIESVSDRRYAHAFNSCVSCGPRFSITDKLPYDRINTSMAEFKMCGECEKEYNSPEKRRFHAETVCCNQCEPYLLYHTNDLYTGNEALRRAVDDLKRGKIIALKGIGGYHFACSPFNNAAVKCLRGLKKRDSKPFAVMFKGIDEVKKVCRVNEKEIFALKSAESPITLLDIKNDIFADEVLCGDLRCGCLLPYTALHYLILGELDMLVMTSANISGSAIVYDNGEMLEFYDKNKSGCFAGVLYNEREILRSVEDSVVQVLPDKKTQIIRRSRGYAPKPLYIEKAGNSGEFLALGGDLKSSFCIVKNKYAYISQYFGDLGDKKSFDLFAAGIKDYIKLFDIEPKFLVCDSHPLYLTSGFAMKSGLPVIRVQHHHAHIASVIAEYSIEKKVIGVAFDGTGYGDDGCVWGGEFLICEGNEYKRAAHLKYSKMIGGDELAADAKKTASCIILREEFDERTPVIKSALEHNINTVNSSSMGRLFDAVSSVLGICDTNGYEGECAVRLQRYAELGLRENIAPYMMKFDVYENGGILIFDGEKIVRLIYEEYVINKKADKKSFALGFHLACAEVIKDICVILRDRENIDAAAVLSGGVFQNRLLTEFALKKLKEKRFEVFMNNMLPCNDGCISFGQAFIGSISGGKI